MILVDLSDSMKEKVQGTDNIIKWDVTVDIITRFLMTLSEEDAVQIVGFKLVPEVLMSEERTIPATRNTVMQLTRRLRRWEPDGDSTTVDIGKAINRAMDLLYNNVDPEITKCENVPTASPCLSSLR